MFLRWVVFLLCIFAAVTVFAESPEHLTMEEIIVTDDTVLEPTATVIGAKTIEKGKNITIPDALKNEPDIGILRKSVIGDNGDVLSIRGLSANRIMLNIDGRTVNSTGTNGGHYIDWGTIPLDNIEKIELIKGGSSVIYGNNALGGVINVITKKPTEKPTIAFYGNYSFGNDIDYVQNYRLTHSYKTGILGYSFAASYQKAAPYLWNNDFEGKNAALSIYLDMPFKGEFSANIQYSNSIRGYILQNRQSTNYDAAGFNQARNPDYPLSLGDSLAPPSGNLSTPGPGAKWNKTKYYFDIAYKQPFGNAEAEVRLYQNLEERNEKNYSWNVVNAAFQTGQLVLDRDLETDKSHGATVKIKGAIGSHELIGGMDYKTLIYGKNTINFVNRNYNTPTQTIREGNPAVEGYAIGLYFQDTWAISNKLLLTGGVRYDVYENKGAYEFPVAKLHYETATPKLTITYKATKNDTITASAYQALRTPGIPETYWWHYGAYQRSALKPEKNTAVEATYLHEFSPFSNIRLSAYNYSIEDYIMFRNNPNGTYNIDNVQLYGISADTNVRLINEIDLRANVTYQKSKKNGDAFDNVRLTNELDYTPKWKANFSFDWRLPYKTLFNIAVNYTGSSKTIYSYSVAGAARYKLIAMDSYTTVDTTFKIPVTKYGEASLYVENLFDKKIEQRFGYPLPGRIMGGAIKIAL